MLRRLFDLIERDRARRFLDGIHSWYQTTTTVSRLCGQAINNEDIASSDIGTVLDDVDRKLFALRNYISDSRGFLRRQNPALARRVTEASKNVYRLRNATARFLIRSQGTGPFSVDQSMSDEVRRTYYYRALEEIGYKARQLQRELDPELSSIWQDLQELIAQAERKIHASPSSI